MGILLPLQLDTEGIDVRYGEVYDTYRQPNDCPAALAKTQLLQLVLYRPLPTEISTSAQKTWIKSTYLKFGAQANLPL